MSQRSGKRHKTALVVTWTPAEIVIDGLKPGFVYEIEFSGGALKVTALTDGVLAPEQSLIFLPLVARP